MVDEPEVDDETAYSVARSLVTVSWKEIDTSVSIKETQNPECVCVHSGRKSIYGAPKLAEMKCLY